MAFFRRQAKSRADAEASSPDSTGNAQATPLAAIPKHVAIIMDGNGRWAQARGYPRVEGHRRGAQTIQRVLEVCREMMIPNLTLYCFSHENWKRPKEELDFLMGLLKERLIDERATLVENKIRLKIIGRREGIRPDIVEEMEKSMQLNEATAKMTLCLAINYGARQEMVDAVRAIASKVASGVLIPSEIDEQTIQDHLYTADMPDPDLLIRTSGELRISNFLLWQISYSELWTTPKPWPDFTGDDFREALQEYSRRQRRFGGLETV